MAKARKTTRKGQKRGPKEERLVIREDPQDALKRLLKPGIPQPANDALTAEHEALKAQTAALQREHEDISDTPDPGNVRHRQHRAKLKTKIAELEAHRKRLKSK
jgi:hypothetical protein